MEDSWSSPLAHKSCTAKSVLKCPMFRITIVENVLCCNLFAMIRQVFFQLALGGLTIQFSDHMLRLGGFAALSAWAVVGKWSVLFCQFIFPADLRDVPTDCVAVALACMFTMIRFLFVQRIQSTFRICSSALAPSRTSMRLLRRGQTNAMVWG